MDEMYLKMILALTDEFFDGWEWNAGDRAILLDDHYKREVLVINTHYQIISSRVAKLLFPGSLEGCKTEEHITRLRPIPRQEQLQKLSGLDWDLYYHDLVKNYSEYNSAEQAGLAMIMYTKCGKIWDGEQWL